MQVASAHSNDMLLAYLPEAECLFVSDIYSPGAGPEPFKVFNRELLSFPVSSGLKVSTIAATHGEIGSIHALEQFLREGS